MTLRTTSIIAGVLGLLMLIAGLFANNARPDRGVVTTETMDTPVVVLGPDVVSLQGLERISVNASGDIQAHTARAVDAEAWLKEYSATYVTGYEGWDALSTRTATRVVLPSVEPSPSPSASASPAAAATTATPAPTPTPSPAPAEDTDLQADEAEAAMDFGSTDSWRSSWRGTDRVSLAVGSLPPGEVFVAYASDGSNLQSVEFSAIRQVNDGWIDPLLWIGGLLTALGVMAALSGLIDTRPVQERAESWLRSRSRAGTDGAVRPGSRRERRLAGSTLSDPVLDNKVSLAPSVTVADEADEADEAAAAENLTKKKGGAE